MTHPTYTQQALSRYNLPRLKRIAAELGVTPTGDKRAADTWINAIIIHQSTQLQKVDEQTTAQAVAPESLTTVEISFFDHEIYCKDELIATIAYDDDLTQPWVVMVDGAEKFRANAWSKCYRYIQWHYQDGTLNEAILPAQAETEEPRTTGNEIMSQIFNECEKFDLELLDDGIYHNNQKLGEVGCTDGHWWVGKAGENTKPVPCLSVADAVRLLYVEESADCEELLDLPFEQLTARDWQRLRKYEPVTA